MMLAAERLSTRLLAPVGHRCGWAMGSEWTALAAKVSFQMAVAPSLRVRRQGVAF